MTRHELLRHLHRVVEPRNYLEIGVRKGRSLALSRVPSIAVDPDFMITSQIRCDVQLVRATSDDFFARSDPLHHVRGGRNPLRNLRRGRPLLGPLTGPPRLDLAFIDGMHLFEYALRDFMNVERHGDWWSVIVVDDILPRNVEEAARDRQTGDWTGDVFKIIAVLRTLRPDLVCLPIDTEPTGTMIILGADPRSRVLARNYDAIVAEHVTNDPQQVPSSILDRAGALPPERVVASPLWRDLVRGRRRRVPRERGLRRIRAHVAALGAHDATRGDGSGTASGSSR